ncbi:hypothetical protein [Flammeovirga aprica]|uniref:Uncharacterized protein n=1 Tax=Flammeovirga aprica JL-4 TaxID=694437 RepID=A0A7X9RZ32_9BACT|nr:hypothetical protein [Flammeovirga aprica]NME71348.1 hypothetical protein [Flammeovirga aprica JL-4]
MLAAGCSSLDKEAIEKEILTLDSIGKREKYLMKVLEDDQKVRNPMVFHDIVTKFGTDSPEYQDLAEQLMEVDKVNQFKIDFYISQYGFPSPKYFSIMAINSPFFVYQHIRDIDKRNGKFPLLYKAYKNGSLSIDLMSSYLGRTYFLKCGKNLVIENPYTPEQELEQLIKALGLNK